MGARGKRSFGCVSRLRSGPWQARYAHRSALGEAARTLATEREGAAWLTVEQARLIQDPWHGASRTTMTLRAWAELWLASHLVAATTLAGFRRDLDKWILPALDDIPALGDVPLRGLHPALVRGWYTAMRQQTAAAASARFDRRSRTLHPVRWWARQHGIAVPASGRIAADVYRAWREAGSPLPPVRSAPAHAGRENAAHVYRTLHVCLQAAVDDQLLARNPARIKGAGSNVAVERSELTRAEVDAFQSTLPARYRAAVVFAIVTRLRAGQVYALRRQDIDFTQRRIHVGNRVIERPGHPPAIQPLATRTTKPARRWLPLTGPLERLLRAHLAGYTAPGPEALVFGTANGTVLRATNRSQLPAHQRRAPPRPRRPPRRTLHPHPRAVCGRSRSLRPSTRSAFTRATQPRRPSVSLDVNARRERPTGPIPGIPGVMPRGAPDARQMRR